MRVVSEKMIQKFWNIVDCHVINVTLHGAKQVMVELRHVDCLMEHKVDTCPSLEWSNARTPLTISNICKPCCGSYPTISTGRLQLCIIRAPAPSTVVSAWESSSKLVSKGLLDDMLEIFKSGLVKCTVRKGAIHLDSRIGSFGVKSWSNIG